jgi:hypothetical protein
MAAKPVLALALSDIIPRCYMEGPYCAAPLDVCVGAAVHFAEKSSAEAVARHARLVINIEGAACAGRSATCEALERALGADGQRAHLQRATCYFEETATRRRLVVVDNEGLGEARGPGTARADYEALVAPRNGAPCAIICVQQLDNDGQPAIYTLD